MRYADELKARNRIGQILLSTEDESMYTQVLLVILDVMASPHGVFGYINDRGDLVVPTMTTTVWTECQVKGKTHIFPREQWSDSSWPTAIRERCIIHSNQPSTNVPRGHVGIQRHISLPLVESGQVVGLIQVANKDSDYTEHDLLVLKSMGDNIAPVLAARIQHQREAAARAHSEGELRKLEWMLRPPSPSREASQDSDTSFSGDLSALNTQRTILGAVGAETLRSIISDYLDLLDTSAAVYESNGDYAAGIFSSNWCRALNQASRRLCDTPDDVQALASGGWLCHEDCWLKASKQAIEHQCEVDAPCAGGLRIYAVPVVAAGRVVGSMNFGYGDPPRDPVRLAEISAAFRIPVEELMALAEAYPSRPSFIIEMAKRRLGISARLVGGIIERREAVQSQQAMEGQLRQAQKMEAIGLLAGGVAHDFNNILQAILGFGTLLSERLPADGEEAECAEEIVTSAMRASGLTSQLLAFSRQQNIAPQVVQLNDLVVNMLKMLGRLIGEDIRMSWKPSNALRPVKLDPGQVNQILANLVLNARDAIVGTGIITIETENADLDEVYCAHHEGAVPGGYAMLAVSDSGIGMEQDTLQRIFEPFFTTKELGKGTGMGLATVYGIVKQNGGFISVYSEPGHGSTFRIYIPVTESPSEAETTETERPRDRVGSECILLVEDDRALLRYGEHVLRSLGYLVLSADSPLKAIEIAFAHPEPIHLLLTDVIMPGMNGRDLHSTLLARMPELKCLFMSGYTSEIIATRGVLDDGVHFIAKPFTKIELADKLREALRA